MPQAYRPALWLPTPESGDSVKNVYTGTIRTKHAEMLRMFTPAPFAPRVISVDSAMNNENFSKSKGI
jgi:hypothetical protein